MFKWVIACLSGALSLSACVSWKQVGSARPSDRAEKPRLFELLRKAQSGLPGKAERYEAFLTAERLALKKDFSNAEILYQAVYDESPGLAVGLNLARTQILMGKPNEAENVIRKVHLLFPSEPQPKLAEAYLAQIRGAPEEALALYRQAYEEHPDDEEVAARLVEALLAAELHAEAEKILKISIRRIPESPYFLLKLARIKFQEKKRTEAKTLLDNLLRIDPDNIEGWTLAGFIALEEKKDEDAESYFRSAYEKQPENDTLAKYYVAQLLKLGRNQEAMRLLLRIEQGDTREAPIDPDLKFQLAAVLFQLEDYPNAKQRFLDLAKTADDPGRMFYFAGQCEENLKQYSAALDLYVKVPKESSFFIPAMQRRMIAHLEIGQTDQTQALLEEYERAASQESASIRFHATVLARLQRFKDAIKVLDRASAKDRTDPEIRYLRAVYLEHTEGLDASLKALEQLIQDKPDFAPALNHLGYTLVERNQRLPFGTKLLERATSLEPKNGYYLDSLGWAYFKLGQLEKAEEKLLRALEFEPEEPIILEHLGELKLKQGRLDMGLRYFERAMGIFETTPEWRIKSDQEWQASQTRVKKRLEELMNLALPRLKPRP